MKMYEDYDTSRDQSNKFFDPQDNALLPCFLPNEYYPDESGTNNLDYMREFQGSYNGVDSTASSKSLIFKTDPDEDTEGWKHKEMKKWTNSDVLHWIASVAEYHKFPYESINANAFSVDGETLMSLTRKDFASRDEKHGPTLYSALHKTSSEFEDIHNLFHPPQNCKSEVKLETLSTPAKIPESLLPLTSGNLKQTTQYGLVSMPEGFHNDITNSSESYPFELDPVTTENNNNNNSSSSSKNISAININNNSNSNVDSIESNSSERKNSTDNSLCSDTEQSDFEVKRKNKKVGKRPPGRPPGVKTSKEKPEKKTGRLWEFIRDLLLDPQHCPSVICWENYDDGVFRFVKSEKVAKIWGDRKGNEKMNYEKLSRAMR
ncbi:UNVERIFIED_CONTAM: hypothetical protein PYX00_005981 [Menopon gallinae]